MPDLAGADLQVANHGTIYLITPESKRGREWIAKHISADAVTWCSGLIVHHSHIRTVTTIITRADLIVALVEGVTIDYEDKT